LPLCPHPPPPQSFVFLPKASTNLSGGFGFGLDSHTPPIHAIGVTLRIPCDMDVPFKATAQSLVRNISTPFLRGVQRFRPVKNSGHRFPVCLSRWPRTPTTVPQLVGLGGLPPTSIPDSAAAPGPSSAALPATAAASAPVLPIRLSYPGPYLRRVTVG